MINTVLFYAIAVGPALYVLFQHIRSKGAQPERDALILALAFTAAMAGQRTYALNDRNDALDEVCQKLEFELVGATGTDYAADYEILPKGCYDDEPAERPYDD